MGVVGYCLLWVRQDLEHQPYLKGSGMSVYGLGKLLILFLSAPHDNILYTQRLHIDYHYGIGPKRPSLLWFWGAYFHNSSVSGASRIQETPRPQPNRKAPD